MHAVISTLCHAFFLPYQDLLGCERGRRVVEADVVHAGGVAGPVARVHGEGCKGKTRNGAVPNAPQDYGERNAFVFVPKSDTCREFAIILCGLRRF